MNLCRLLFLTVIAIEAVGQGEEKGGSLSFAGYEVNFTAHALDQGFYDVQAQASAALSFVISAISLGETLKYLRVKVSRNAAAVIPN